MATLLIRWSALAWLVLFEPFDLALPLSRLLLRPEAARWPVLLLVATRVVAVGLGLAVGIGLARAASTRILVRAWLAAEAISLAVIWSTDLWPTNRAPGLLAPTVAVYLAGAVCVLAATAAASRRAENGRPADLPTSLRSR